MKLKHDIDLVSFLKRVKDCRDEVYFETEEKDILNLKSMLSLYVFTAMVSNEDFLYDGHVVCREPSDEELLREYTVSEAVS